MNVKKINMSPAIIKATNNENKGVLEYEGSNFLRARLVLATLSGRPIRIRQIRTKEENPGLNEAEASLIRLFDKISNGCKFEVSETGTALYYQPGRVWIIRLSVIPTVSKARNNIGYFPTNKDSNFQDYLLEEMWNTTAAFNEELDIT